MKKTLTFLSILLFILAGCSSPSHQNGENTKIEYPMVPETDAIITSPSLPSQLTVNGETVSINSESLLSVGNSLIDVPVILPTDTFDTMETTSISAFKGIKIIHSVPSLDTPVCSIQTRQLDTAAKEFTDMQFLTISADLPFALKRFVTTNGIDTMNVLSDYKNNDFAKANNLFLEEYQLSTRAIMIVDENNVVQYIEYASEVTKEINVENAVNFLRQNYNQ